MNTGIACVMRIVLLINQGVRKVILSNPYCESWYMYALLVIQAGEQFSDECQKSWIIPIPVLSLLYDHNSQCYSCMSIVKNIDLIYQQWIRLKHSQRTDPFSSFWKSLHPALVHSSAGNIIMVFRYQIFTILYNLHLI